MVIGCRYPKSWNNIQLFKYIKIYPDTCKFRFVQDIFIKIGSSNSERRRRCAIEFSPCTKAPHSIIYGTGITGRVNIYVSFFLLFWAGDLKYIFIATDKRGRRVFYYERAMHKIRDPKTSRKRRVAVAIVPFYLFHRSPLIG